MKNFLSKLLKKNNPPYPENKPAETKSYLKSKDVKEIIYAKAIFSDMDFSEITGNVAQILYVVGKEEDGEELKHLIQHQYYRFLFHHYWLEKPKAQLAKDILQISAKDDNDLLTKWPADLTFQKYQELYKALELDVVSRVKLSEPLSEKYILALNLPFWEYQHRDTYNLLIDVTSTYEREFQKSAWIFETEDDALNYAILMCEFLCITRGPDNLYYYAELVIKQFEKAPPSDKIDLYALGMKPHTGLPKILGNIGYNFIWNKANIDKLIESKPDEVHIMKQLFSKIPTPPFYIIQSL